MKIEETPIPDLLILAPQRHGDKRGFFSESWNRATMEKAGLRFDFVQYNHSMSQAVVTLRGLHMQTPPLRRPSLFDAGGGLCSTWLSISAKDHLPTADGSELN